MKATIMEIGKDYCIVMTRDGQFIKQKIPSGVFEIGDEITVSKEYAFKPKTANINIKWVRSFAVAASVVIVVVVGSVFGVWYLRQYYASRNITLFTEDANREEMTVGEEAPAEETAEEQKEEGIKEPAVAMTAGEEKTITFESIYSFTEQPEVIEDIEEIIQFSYEIVDNVSLRIRLKNISSTLSFDGTFKLVMLLSDETESRTEVISLDGFGPGKIKEQPLFLKAGEMKLKLEVTGSTY